MWRDEENDGSIVETDYSCRPGTATEWRGCGVGDGERIADSNRMVSDSVYSFVASQETSYTSHPEPPICEA